MLLLLRARLSEKLVNVVFSHFVFLAVCLAIFSREICPITIFGVVEIDIAAIHRQGQTLPGPHGSLRVLMSVLPLTGWRIQIDAVSLIELRTRPKIRIAGLRTVDFISSIFPVFRLFLANLRIDFVLSLGYVTSIHVFDIFKLFQRFLHISSQSQTLPILVLLGML